MTDPTVSREDLAEMIKDALAIYSNGVDDLWDQDVASDFVADALISSGVVRGQDWRPTHRHVKRGTEYEVLSVGVVQTETPLVDNDFVVIYRGEDGALWARNAPEFRDGRFEPLPAPPIQQPDGGGQ